MSAPLWLSEADVIELLALDEAIDVLDGAHRDYASGGAQNMVRTHATDGDGILHAVGGLAGGLAGTKTWMHTPGGAQPLLVLFAPADGRVVAVIEAFAMGQMRTAATSGVGTRLLARADAATLALLGTGKQALRQAEAIVAVRPIERVKVFGRDAERRDRFVAHAAASLSGVAVQGYDDVAETLAGADVATFITRAAEPFVGADVLPPGVHVNAVGAIVPQRRELTPDAVGLFDLIAVDSLAQARTDAGELQAAEEAGHGPWQRTHELGDLLTGVPDRAVHDRTLLKALGVGLADVALGAELARRAGAAGLGRPLPTSSLIHH